MASDSRNASGDDDFDAEIEPVARLHPASLARARNGGNFSHLKKEMGHRLALGGVMTALGLGHVHVEALRATLGLGPVHFVRTVLPKPGNRAPATFGQILANYLAVHAGAALSTWRAKDEEKAALGAVLRCHAFERNDTIALDGFLASELRICIQSCQRLGDKNAPTTVGQMLHGAITLDRQYWHSVAPGLYWGRAFDRYDRRRTDWAENGDSFGRWRKRPPTRQQEEVVAAICEIRDLPIPELLTRGDASDFIDAHGGNPRFWEARRD